jgi:hypothetical protein
MKNTKIIDAAKITLTMVLVLAFAPLFSAPIAFADDFDGYSFDTASYGDYSYDTPANDYTYDTPSFSGYTYDTPASDYTYDTPSFGGYTYDTPALEYTYDTPVSGYTYDTPVVGGYTYDTPVVGYTYDTPAAYGYLAPSYGSSGYSSGGYYTPNYTYGSSYYTPGYTYEGGTTYVPQRYNQPAPSQSTRPNTLCSGTNNCNTTHNTPVNQTPVSVVVDNNNNNTNNNSNTNNNVITINNPAPVTTVIKERERSRPDYRQPTYYQPPVYTGSNPYVSLSAVPYTGLELGPYGTVIYWSALILWCLFVAYMVVVKRVHIKIARWFKTFLFGGAAVAVAATEVAPTVKREVAQIPVQTLDKTDDFIMAQVLRRA